MASFFSFLGLSGTRKSPAVEGECQWVRLCAVFKATLHLVTRSRISAPLAGERYGLLAVQRDIARGSPPCIQRRICS
jgi:hypothetical protein